MSWNNTNIRWTKKTFNPVTGCTKISAGCLNCYANEAADMKCKGGNAKYANGFDVTMHWELLDEPLRHRKPQLVFVGSMCDIFHEDVTDEFLIALFDVMRRTPQHTYQLLTKRPERMVAFAKTIEWPQNAWAGVSIENNDYVYRADLLREVEGATVRFLSCEPLLSGLPDLDLTGIDQVIVGGESGTGFRTMDVDWARDLRDRCVDAGVAFFFKQWSAIHPKQLGHLLDGTVWSEMPDGRYLEEDVA